MTRRASRPAAALLVLAAPLVIALLLEGASRIFYLLRWGRLYPIHEIHYSLRLGWELAPGAYRRYQISSQGFRRPEDGPLRRPAEVVRIFLVGGSAAFGSDGLYPGIPSSKLEYEDLVDYHLQTLLQSRHPGRRFEVINAAVPKYRLFQEITLFQEKLVNFAPDLVIFLDGHNDASSLTGGAAFAHGPAPYWSSPHTDLGQQGAQSVAPVGAALLCGCLPGEGELLLPWADGALPANRRRDGRRPRPVEGPSQPAFPAGGGTGAARAGRSETPGSRLTPLWTRRPGGQGGRALSDGPSRRGEPSRSMSHSLRAVGTRCVCQRKSRTRVSSDDSHVPRGYQWKCGRTQLSACRPCADALA